MRYDYNTYSEVVSDIVKKGEQVVDNFWNLLEHPDFPFVTLTSTTNGYRNFPPYNIIESEDNRVRLEMAVAGYTKEQISVEKQGNVLIIKGKPAEQSAKENVRHRGISSAAFLRTFELTPTTEVAEVGLKDGILTVYVQSTKPQQPPTTTFEIK
jgi:molecular chaperone IbpA